MKLPSWLSRRTLASRVEQALEAQVRTASSSASAARAGFRPGPANAKGSGKSCTPTPTTMGILNRRAFAHQTPRRSGNKGRQAGDDPSFSSIVDNPPELVRASGGRRHGPGLLVLAVIPVTAFVLGTWQVQRLGWKTELIARFEDRLVREPLPLPPRVDPDAIHEFDYRRVLARGRFRHDAEMLIGPRMRDGEQGYMVVTPLERDNDPAATVLVNRGWISKKMRDRRAREAAGVADLALPTGEVVVEGLLREPWKKNMFTPDNRPEIGEFYFPDVEQMAKLAGSQPIWVEQTMGELPIFPSYAIRGVADSIAMILYFHGADLDRAEPDLFQAMEYEAKGVPIGRPAEVNLRNNHAQYIFTW